RPVARAAAGELEQGRPLLALASEGALAGGEETAELETIEPRPRHRFRVAGDEREPRPRRLERRQSLRGPGPRFPPGCVRAGEELEVVLGKADAPAVEPRVDRRIVEAGCAEDVAGDPLRAQAAVLDVRGRIGGDSRAVDFLERRNERSPTDRVVREEEGPVEIEQRERRRQIPSRSSIAVSRRHLGRVLTWSSRKICRPSRSSISGRARVPICLTTEPARPTTICFCDSVSTKRVAWTTFSPSSSTSTEIACGTSSRVSWRAFSR